MLKKSVQPEDILPDDVDSTPISGRMVRKGTIAAFLANIDILEDLHLDQGNKQEAFDMLITLAPAVIAIGLHKHVVFKNPEVEQILLDAYKLSLPI